MWRERANGLPEVRRRLAELSRTTKNECFALYVPTKEIVACVNVGGVRPKIAKRLVGQIAYDQKLSMARTDVLRRMAMRLFL
jgi:hypothetical protein